MLPRVHADRIRVSPWRWSRIKTRIHVYSVRHKLTSWDLISWGLSVVCRQGWLGRISSLSLSSCLHWLFDYSSISKLKFKMFYWRLNFEKSILKYIQSFLIIFIQTKNDFIEIAFFCTLTCNTQIKCKKRCSLLI